MNSGFAVRQKKEALFRLIAKEVLSMKCFKWDDIIDIVAASSYEDLAKVALRVLRRMPPPVAMICGPIYHIRRNIAEGES